MTDPRSIAQSASLELSINRTLRSAFILLAIVLACAAAGTFVGLSIELPRMRFMWLVFLAVFIGGPFVIRSIKNLQTAILVTCLWAGLVGLMMSPMIGRFLSFAGGPQILFNALATTAVAFVALSGYAIVSRRNFSFLGGFLFVGFLLALVAIIANIFLQIPVLSLTISSVVVLLCAGSMLYNVSRLVHDGASDALMIVVELFADIAVMFSHLLNLFGFMSGDD
jgi:modulator of FtsH protease